VIRADEFLEPARRAGFRLFTGVPCSYLKPFINFVIDAPDLEYVGATNEGDAVAIASGAEIAGLPSVVMFQNSGLGNAVNPLTSLSLVSRLPVLLIVTWRGEPGGAHDEPQHAAMGPITPALLETMGIPWAIFPESAADVPPALAKATAHLERARTPYAFIMRKDTVAAHELRTHVGPRDHGAIHAEALGHAAWPGVPNRPARREVLRAVQEATQGRDAVIATTGFTGRALYALGDLPNQFYMVGSMGCASSFGLGVARAQPARRGGNGPRVVVLDGDGAALMRLGAMATIGFEAPPNLVHVVLDNEVHDSTGGQSTVSHTTDLAGVARACGYARVLRALDGAAVAAALETREASQGPLFVHVKTAPGEASDLPRPKVTPEEVASRFRQWLSRTRNA
jgi:phosphonopyruvate decarboxylase